VFDASAGRIAFTIGNGRANGLAVMNADGSDIQRLLEPVDIPGQPHGGTEAPRWIPGDRILFHTNRYGGPDDFHVYVIDADGGEPLQVTGGDDGIESYGVMSRDGMTLVYGKAVPTPDGPDPFRDAGLFVSDPDGSNERQLTTTTEGGLDEWPDISPDGQRVAFTRAHDPEGGLYIIKLDGTDQQLLVDAQLEPQRPRWSPDGSLIVFHSHGTSFATESANLFVVAPDGSDLRQLTHESVPGQAWATDWSPDGEHIVFVHTPRGVNKAYLDVIGLDGAMTCRLLEGWDPDWGPAS
jgi:Tol biopolymer transport system component